MERDEIVEMIKKLVQTQKHGVLATSSEDGAYASLMAYISVDEGRQIAFASEKETRKYYNLQRDEDVALLIDDRSNPEKDPGDIMTVTAIGRVHPAPSDRASSLRDQLAEGHPRLQNFLMKDNCTVLVLEVDEYRVVGRFQTGDELETVVYKDEL